MSDLALLGTRFITEGAEQTNRQLDQYAANANRAADASDKASGSTSRLSASMRAQTTAAERDARAMAEAQRSAREYSAAADRAAASAGGIGLAAKTAAAGLAAAGAQFIGVISVVEAFTSAVEQMRIATEGAAESSRGFANSMAQAEEAINGVAIATFKLADARKEAARQTIAEQIAANNDRLAKFENPSAMELVGRGVGTITGLYRGAEVAKEMELIRDRNAALMRQGIELTLQGPTQRDAAKLLDEVLPKEAALVKIREERAQVEAYVKAGLIDSAAAQRAYNALDKEAADLTRAKIGTTSEAEKAAKKSAEELKRAREATAAYIASLSRELQSIGQTSEALRRLAADREIEAALKQGDVDSAVRIHQMVREIEATEELAQALEYMAKARKVARDAAANVGPLNTIPRDVTFDPPDKLEELLKVMEDVQRRAEATRWAVDDIFWSVRSNDWVGAFSGLLRVLDQVKKAFADGANSADKFNAVASVVSAVGGQIGGKAGGALSGAASAASAAFSVTGNPLIAAGAAVIGGITGWLSGDKAERARKNAEALRRAEEELAAVRQIAAERRSLEIELMEAQGNAAGALAAKRKDELAAMNASNRALQEAVWAAQDLAAERQKLVDAAQRNVDDARNRLSDAYRQEANALQSYIDRFRGWSDSLTKFLKGLYTGPSAMLSPEEQYRAAKADFDKVSGLAAGGDEAAIRDLETVSQAYLDASKAYYATSAEYFSDLEKVRAAVAATQGYAASQVNVGEQQLSALNASVSGILQVNQSVLSVRDALAAYQEAVLVLAAAQAATQAANDNAARGPDWGSYIANSSDVAAEYLRNMGSEKGRKYLAALGISSIEQFGQWHWNNYGQAEGRTPYARGGIIDRPMTVGESGIAGENGKESIMPLANVGGKMGVHAVAPDQTESVELLKAIVRQQQKMIDELKADKAQRSAIDEENGKRFARVEDELERLTRTKAAA